MSISTRNVLSLFITGRPTINQLCPEERYNPTPEELADMEMSQEDWDFTQNNSFRFEDPTLSENVNWNSFTGYCRNSGLSVFDSLFSGIGAGVSKKIDFFKGAFLAVISIFTSLLSGKKNIPFLSSYFGFDNYGGRLIRSSLHFFDSIFSHIGEKGAEYSIPSMVLGLGSVFSLNRVLRGEENTSIRVPFGSIGGTVGRTAIHHAESMLATKASQFSNFSPFLSSFAATSLSTAALTMPEQILNKNLPVQSLEGLSAQVLPHFLDSTFSNIGNTISKSMDTTAQLALGLGSSLISIPIVNSLSSFRNAKAQIQNLRGKLIRSFFNIPETILFNSGNSVGKSILGLPLAIIFGGLTYACSISKKLSFKNIKIPLDTVGGFVHRLPFGFLNGLTSTVGTRISSFIPAPILTLVAPAISYQLGERVKGINARYDELSGLMIRNSTHLWESMVSSAAYRTGKMLTGDFEGSNSSGSLFGERWITDEGQIVSSMAIGKQMADEEDHSVLKSLAGGISGAAIGSAASLFTAA